MTTSELNEWFEMARNYFNHGYRPATIQTPIGRLKCDYKNDPDEGDVPYVQITVGQPSLPQDCFIEIDGETYGSWIGFRIYLEPYK